VKNVNGKKINAGILILPGVRATTEEAVSKLAGEHKVHPYLPPETLCRGESCIRPHPVFNPFLGF